MANRFSRKSRREKRGIVDDFNSFFGLPYSSNSTSLTTAKTMQLSAVYRSVEVITDGLASMPIGVETLTEGKGWSVNRKHPASHMLNSEPSGLMTRFTLFKTLIAKMLLDGNGIARIRRDKSGDPLSIELVVNTVNFFRKEDNSGMVYRVYDPITEDYEFVDGDDIIHVLNFTYDGMIGVSTLTHAALSTGLAMAAEKQAAGFFKGGANLSGVLKVNGKVTPEKAAALKTAWKAAFETESGDPAGVAVVEAGTEFTPVMVNPKDAQMLESRQFSVVEICRFFGVSPTKAFDTNANSYNSVEAGQLAFLTDTMQALVSKVENELNRKLWRPSQKLVTRARFDTDELIRMDSDSQANYFMKMFQVGGYTTNEIRERIGNPKVKEGDVPYVQVNMQPLGTIKSTVESKTSK